MTKHVYPDGLDRVWIATDSNGYVAAFVTGGVGPIPIQAWNGELLPLVEEAVNQLPPVSDAHLLVSMKRPDDFVAMATRGFFVYDWSDVHRSERESTRTYEQIAVPLNPIQSNELPESLVDLAGKVRFRNLVFAEEKAVNVLAQFECSEFRRHST